MKNITDVVQADIYQTSEQSQRLKRQVSQCMPAQLAEQILFIRLADSRLRITVGSSAWAARLRFHGREITRTLAQPPLRLTIREISIHVLPDSRSAEVAVRKSRRLRPRAGHRSVSMIRQVVQSLGQDEDDAGLKDALGRLASNLASNLASDPADNLADEQKKRE